MENVHGYVIVECTLPYEVNSEICLLTCLLDSLIVCLICHPLYGRKPFKYKPMLHQTSEYFTKHNIHYSYHSSTTRKLITTAL